MSKLPNMQ